MGRCCNEGNTAIFTNLEKRTQKRDKEQAKTPLLHQNMYNIAVFVAMCCTVEKNNPQCKHIEV